jgi:hypothetical protein
MGKRFGLLFSLILIVGLTDCTPKPRELTYRKYLEVRENLYANPNSFEFGGKLLKITWYVPQTNFVLRQVMLAEARRASRKAGVRFADFDRATERYGEYGWTYTRELDFLLTCWRMDGGAIIRESVPPQIDICSYRDLGLIHNLISVEIECDTINNSGDTMKSSSWAVHPLVSARELFFIIDSLSVDFVDLGYGHRSALRYPLDVDSFVFGYLVEISEYDNVVNDVPWCLSVKIYPMSSEDELRGLLRDSNNTILIRINHEKEIMLGTHPVKSMRHLMFLLREYSGIKYERRLLRNDYVIAVGDDVTAAEIAEVGCFLDAYLARRIFVVPDSMVTGAEPSAQRVIFENYEELDDEPPTGPWFYSQIEPLVSRARSEFILKDVLLIILIYLLFKGIVML